jgi:hypothetical protein
MSGIRQRVLVALWLNGGSKRSRPIRSSMSVRQSRDTGFLDRFVFTVDLAILLRIAG